MNDNVVTHLSMRLDDAFFFGGGVGDDVRVGEKLNDDAVVTFVTGTNYGNVHEDGGCKVVVLSFQLCGCETWTPFTKDIPWNFYYFSSGLLRKVMGIKWEESMVHTEAPNGADIPVMFAFVTNAQLRWTERVHRIDAE